MLQQILDQELSSILGDPQPGAMAGQAMDDEEEEEVEASDVEMDDYPLPVESFPLSYDDVDDEYGGAEDFPSEGEAKTNETKFPFKKNIIYACDLRKLSWLIEYVVFVRNKTEDFLFAQFLRRVPSFAAIGPSGVKIWRGASEAPPPLPQSYEAQNKKCSILTTDIRKQPQTSWESI